MRDFEFLGRGWAFPISVAPSGQMCLSEYELDVADAVRIILHTAKGERVMRPDFGCDLRQYVFSSITLSTLSKMSDEVKNSLVMWESRIEDIEVEVTPNEAIGRVDISVSYSVRMTNNRYNTVFPYYLDEGR